MFIDVVLFFILTFLAGITMYLWYRVVRYDYKGY